MALPTIFCPACVATVPETHVEWEALRATCASCGLVLVLDDELIPQAPVPGYPERLLERRDGGEEGSPWVVSRDGATTRVRHPGLLGAWGKKSIVVGPGGVLVTAWLGRHQERLEAVRGVLPVQWVRWAYGRASFGETERRSAGHGARTRLLTTDGLWRVVYEHPTGEEARHVAAVLNDALDRARATSPYRG